MAAHAYRLVNVFTRGGDPLSGNPLCVFEDGAGLDERAMQALARQFNLSETTFILPSSRASAHVRIFTPSYEMPFAGHPTLGTAHVCRALGLGSNALTLEMRAGIVPVSAAGYRWTLQATVRRSREVAETREVLAAMLGVEPTDIAERPLWVSTGREQLIIPLTSTDAVMRARPQPDRLAQLQSEDGASMAYVFAAREEPGRSSIDVTPRSERLLARFFFSAGAVCARRSCHRLRDREPRRLVPCARAKTALQVRDRAGRADGAPLVALFGGRRGAPHQSQRGRGRARAGYNRSLKRHREGECESGRFRPGGR